MSVRVKQSLSRVSNPLRDAKFILCLKSEVFFRSVINFLDKELFTDVAAGERHEADLVVKARFKGQDSFFLVHIETQAQPQTDFSRRMFRYFARLYEKHNLPVYPVAVFSYDRPRSRQPSAHRVKFPDLAVLEFRYRVIQVNCHHQRWWLVPVLDARTVFPRL